MRPPCDPAVIRSQDAVASCGHAQGAWILAATIVASSMAFIDSTVVNVALPALQSSFHAGVVGVQWVVEAYGLTLASLILVGGSMGDLLGRRRIFLLGASIFVVASMACGFAPSIEGLIAARAIQGIGAALLVPGSLALISACFDEAERGRAIGTWSGSTAITTAIGPVLGGWLVQHLSWRWAFFLNLPLAVFVIAIGLRCVPESRSRQRRILDGWGAVAATLSLTGLVFAFVQSSNLGWGSPLILAAITGGVIGAAIFLWIEARAESPMVPLTLFRSRAFSGANLLTFFLYSAVSIFFFVLPLNLIQVQGYSPTAAGAAILPLILLMFLLSRWSGGLVHRYGARGPLVLGPVIAASGFFLFSLPSVGTSYWTAFFPAMLTLGFGMSLSVAPLTTVVMTAVDQDHVGTASGINNAVSRVAGVLSIAVLGVVMVAGFRSELTSQLNELTIADNVRMELQADAMRLAALKPPPEVDRNKAASIESSIFSAFVFSFRRIMWICSVLSVASSVVALRCIPGATTTQASRDAVVAV